MTTSTTPQPYTAGRPENSTTSGDANQDDDEHATSARAIRCVVFRGVGYINRWMIPTSAARRIYGTLCPLYVNRFTPIGA